MTAEKNNWYLKETDSSFFTAELAAHAILAQKGEDVSVLDLRGVSDVTDFFVLATANSTAQVSAISNSVRDDLKAAGIAMLHSEGGGSLQWVLLDFADIVVHLLQPKAREFYRLENLWSDAARVEIGAEYFQHDEIRSRHPDLMLCRRGMDNATTSEPDQK